MDKGLKVLMKVENNYKGKIKYLSRRLKYKGFNIENILETLGIIVAKPPRDFDLKNFKMKGIKYFEEDRKIKKVHQAN